MVKHISNMLSLTRNVSSKANFESICARCIDSKSPDYLHQEAKNFVQAYKNTLEPSRKKEMVQYVADTCGINHDNLKAAILKYEKNPNAVYDINTASAPRYSQLFQSIGNLEKGVKFVCDFRADVLEYLKSGETPKDKLLPLRRLETSLKDLLTVWFCLSNLRLTRMTWQSPADILQKVAKEEAVHPVQGLIDMQRRLGPCRRCFVFFSDMIPREPLVIVYVALTRTISDNVVNIMRETNLTEEDERSANTAIYYSISSTQAGLKGIDLGNMLIKQVVAELMHENPSIVNHSTLSPIPGFRTWLLRCLAGASEYGDVLDDYALNYLRSFPGFENSTSEEFKAKIISLIATNSIEKYTPLKDLFMYFASVYILKAKNSKGYALNPVANFHLRNGAEVYRLNWAGNPSHRGIDQSLGIMVNYRYVMENITKNNENYVNNKVIATQEIMKLSKLKSKL